MRTRLSTLLVLLAACTGTPTVPAEPPDVQGPDVVLITLDTTRADRLGCYGDPLARTPNLDALALDSVLFREATTPVPLTLPAHASLLSGWYPTRHGIRDNGGFRVGPTVPLLSEKLDAEGWHTGAFVASYVLDGSWGLDRGFDRYFDDFHPQDVQRAERFGAVERPAREVVREALAWFEAPEQAEGRRFLWVHLFDAHTPYEPPVDWKGDPYRGEIFEMDRALRPLLESLPDSTLIIVASDHGENLWDGEELEHGTVLSRSTTRIPLLIRPPGGVKGAEHPAPRTPPARPATWVPVEGLSPEGLVLDVVVDAPVAGRVVEVPVSLVDVMPTVLEVLGLPASDVDGRSLAPALRGEDLAVVPVYSESVAAHTHFGWAPQFVARDATRLLRRDAGDEVFDAVADPWWQVPLAEAAPAPLLAAIERLSPGWEHPGGAIDPATAAALEAMGYRTTQITPTEGERPSARTRMSHMHRLALAQGTMKSDPEAAVAGLEALVAEDPDLVDAWFSLATLRWGGRDADGAITALRQVVERAPDHPLAWNNLIVVLRDSGREDEALTTATQLASTHPRDTRWHRHRVDLYGRRERPAEVAAAAQQGIDATGGDPFLFYMLGLAQVQLDDPAAAIEAFTRAIDARTEANDVNLWLGIAHEKLGQIDEAVAAFSAQANATPGDVRPTVAAGMLLAENKRCADALPFLLTALQRGVREERVRKAYETCGGF
jgi:arylsulfatase A-like enzyme/Flp pilus assembly protein TadD